jgi:hypothetical protein
MQQQVIAVALPYTGKDMKPEFPLTKTDVKRTTAIVLK